MGSWHPSLVRMQSTFQMQLLEGTTMVKLEVPLSWCLTHMVDRLVLAVSGNHLASHDMDSS